MHDAVEDRWQAYWRIHTQAMLARALGDRSLDAQEREAYRQYRRAYRAREKAKERKLDNVR